MGLGMSDILEIFKSIGIIIASGAAIWGINSWRREAMWKRKYELAEEVLANMYEAHQAIQIIRSPFGFGEEGSSRRRGENETPDESKIYDQAYVSRERFERNKRSLEKIQPLKFRFIALYGKDFSQHFDTFSSAINKIFFASDDIARVRLGQYASDNNMVSSILKESRQTLYSRPENDELESELKEAIDAIETKCQEVIRIK